MDRSDKRQMAIGVVLLFGLLAWFGWRDYRRDQDRVSARATAEAQADDRRTARLLREAMR